MMRPMITRRHSILVAGSIFLVAVTARLHSQAGIQRTPATPTPPGVQASYVGSSRCSDCHPAVYARWSKTRMANVDTDPKVHREVIIPDFAKADPLLTF